MFEPGARVVLKIETHAPDDGENFITLAPGTEGTFMQSVAQKICIVYFGPDIGQRYIYEDNLKLVHL